jgi:amino acid transporter
MSGIFFWYLVIGCILSFLASFALHVYGPEEVFKDIENDTDIDFNKSITQTIILVIILLLWPLVIIGVIFDNIKK